MFRTLMVKKQRASPIALFQRISPVELLCFYCSRTEPSPFCSYGRFIEFSSLPIDQLCPRFTANFSTTQAIRRRRRSSRSKIIKRDDRTGEANNFNETSRISTKKQNELDPDSFDQREKFQHGTIGGQLQSMPNLITLSRMTSTPLLCYWITTEQYELAIFGCFVAGLSDAADGYIAKNYNGDTILGTYLDPLADKVLINSLAVSLWYKSILPTPLIAIWATKDILLLTGMGFYLWKDKKSVNFFSNSIATKPLKVTPSALGKINTVLQFTTLGLGLVSPILEPNSFFEPIVLQGFCYITGSTSVLTLLSYAGQSGFEALTTSINTQTKA